MRHELQMGEWVITSDNSAAIGEKPHDVVAASDKITAKFAARVALLEQWAAGSDPEAILLHNFSGETQWNRYAEGIHELFAEIGIEAPKIAGSSETNMETLQSGLAVTMLGRRREEINSESLQWFIYGMPLVGKEVLEKREQIADMKKIYEALRERLAAQIWPVGSKGIAKEAEHLFGRKISMAAEVDLEVSGGPASCVLIGVRPEQIESLKLHFGQYVFPLEMEAPR
ncbi:alpha-ribazole-5-phosphate synthase [Planococcus shenhongbingii]|uniref:alpha-ribazole-5-phosphate synthase n=1 Tax=Planococcus shenhongbingii TaxID=3058398 RepID=UPI002621B6D7|nr:alpha-ribazole-5-phosphate synthase [Planococcus sp. N016]WKA57905.1 alpha-ribazole-5-phosphate synthase [Planococcus sp. N016]